jgi:Skp family chaperone for outer membrane proteins
VAAVKKLAALLAVLCLSALPLAAQTQTVTKIGIINFTRVLLTAYKDTKAYRDFDQAQGDYAKEIANRTKEITDLQSQKLDADKAKNTNLSLSLEKSIADKQKDLASFRQIKGQILQQQLASLQSGPALAEILDVVRFISEQGGFALVLRSDTDAMKSAILFFIPEIDITDEVIAEIQSRQAKATAGN